MVKDTAINYEEIRKQRVEDNRKRFEDLGLLKIAKSLSDVKKTEKKTVQRNAKPKSESIYLSEPRRSSRARNPIVTYQDEVDIGLPPLRKRMKLHSSWASYLARPADEVKTPTYEEIARAFKYAEKIQSNLISGNPSFIKTMVRSHVYSCFWLGLPSRFCEDHLPKTTVDIVLEAENGSEYDAVYIGTRSGLSGGWRAFALDFKLDAGDAVVFELTEQWRFKVYIVRASTCDTDEEPEKTNDSTKNGKTKIDKKVLKTKKKDTPAKPTRASTCDSDENDEPEKANYSTKNGKTKIDKKESKTKKINTSARPTRASTRNKN